jgi:hypothetical protein
MFHAPGAEECGRTIIALDCEAVLEIEEGSVAAWFHQSLRFRQLCERLALVDVLAPELADR